VRSKPRLDREAAETIAARALQFLAEDRERLVRFLQDSGVSPDDLRARAGSMAVLAAVLDHLLGDESALLSFAANAGVAPESIAPAAELLGGGR